MYIVNGAQMSKRTLLLKVLLIATISTSAVAQQLGLTNRVNMGSFHFRKAFDSKGELPPDTTNRFRNTAALDFEALAKKQGCTIRRMGSEDYERASRETVNMYSHNEENKLSRYCQIELMVGRHGSADARHRLFGFLWTSSGGAAPEVLAFRSSGLGDFYFAHKMALKEMDARIVAATSIAFCRDNIAVSIFGADDTTDLFPIARDLDEAIQRCPLRATPEEAGIVTDTKRLKLMDPQYLQLSPPNGDTH